MTTTASDRQVLREWRDTHDDVRPARGGETCVHSVWVGERWAGRCGRLAEWLINYGLRVPSLGVRPHCEAHTVDTLRKWAAYEHKDKKEESA